MKPAVKVFTKDVPCTKLDIWNCFASQRGGFRTVQVDEAHSIIGKNVPRIMERKGNLERVSSPLHGDCYSLTAAGKQWLDRGFRNYLRNHPLQAKHAKVLPSAARAVRKIIRVRGG